MKPSKKNMKKILIAAIAGTVYLAPTMGIVPEYSVAMAATVTEKQTGSEEVVSQEMGNYFEEMYVFYQEIAVKYQKAIAAKDQKQIVQLKKKLTALTTYTKKMQESYSRIEVTPYKNTLAQILKGQQTMLSAINQDVTGEQFAQSAATNFRFMDMFYIELRSQGQTAQYERIMAMKVGIVEAGRQVSEDGKTVHYSPLAQTLLSDFAGEGVSPEEANKKLGQAYTKLVGKDGKTEDSEFLLSSAATPALATPASLEPINVKQYLDYSLTKNATDEQLKIFKNGNNGNFFAYYWDGTTLTKTLKSNLSITTLDNGKVRISVPDTGIAQKTSLELDASLVSPEQVLNTNGWTSMTNVLIGDTTYQLPITYTTSKDFYMFAVGGSWGSSNGKENFAAFGGLKGTATPLANLPTSGTAVFGAGSDAINLVVSNRNFLAVDWATGKVVMAGNPGVVLFGSINKTTGAVNLSSTSVNLNNSFVEKINKTYTKATISENDAMKFYGSSSPEVLAGILPVSGTATDGSVDTYNLMLGGFRDTVNTAYRTNSVQPVTGEVWQGFSAVKARVNGTTAEPTIWTNKTLGDVILTFNPSVGEVTGQFKVNTGFETENTSTSTTLTTNNSAFVSKDYLAGSLSGIQQNLQFAATAGTESNQKLDYLTWGYWGAQNATSSGLYDVMQDRSLWIAGQLTPVSNVPTFGSLTYNGMVYDGYNNGSLNLTANFATRGITGTFNFGGSLGSMSINNGTVSSGVNAFNGNLAGSYGTGTFNGAFYGPNAQEIGGVWRAAKTGTNVNGSTANGIFAGKL